ncbi:DNA-directed RNA polymerase subunit beta [Nocardia sp. CA-135953]|uniref:DNA-directed RNA polymerase subunit beta n=1 Tax=Nocardia sp. CA-135953 TaxID=3239978 RepID=UPI003D999408
MLNPDLPHRRSFVGPPIPWPVECRVDVLEQYINALRALPTEPTSTEQPDTEVSKPMGYIGFGDTPLSRCHFYRRVCDLPANVDPPQLGRIVMKVEHVGALTMPAHLGQSVKTYMQQCGSDLGPVCSHPRQNRWAYLIRPDIPDDTRLFAEMYRLDVQVVRAGGTVALPSPADKGAQFRRWIEPPRCTFRPSGLVVVDAIRACSGRYPMRR